jgi:hypothetical protein
VEQLRRDAGGGRLRDARRTAHAAIFASGLVAPSTYTVALPPPDATLASGSNAIDAGAMLPNVDDASAEQAPDLGALERGCPSPLYGVRPDGIDETNEPYGCGGPTVTTTTLPWVTIQSTALKLGDGGTPTTRRISFKSTTTRDSAAHRIVVPAAGGPGDPTVAGATLSVYATTGPASATVALPAAGWSILGSPGSVTGVRVPRPGSDRGHRDRAATCRSPAAEGRRPELDVRLSTPPERRVAVRLALGTERPWCAAAPAKVSGNPPSSAASDTASRFVGQPKTPAPLVCPPTP